MSEVWYQTGPLWREPLIRKVLVDRSTDLFVIINGRREAKLSEWNSYFPSMEMAHQSLIGKAKMELAMAKDALSGSEETLNKVMELKTEDIK